MRETGKKSSRETCGPKAPTCRTRVLSVTQTMLLAKSKRVSALEWLRLVCSDRYYDLQCTGS